MSTPYFPAAQFEVEHTGDARLDQMVANWLIEKLQIQGRKVTIDVSPNNKLYVFCDPPAYEVPESPLAKLLGVGFKAIASVTPAAKST